MADHEVIILLHIAEANGLYHRNEHVQITASLGGITLESEALMPGQTTVFDINLVWETDKKVIKRMKTENLPIRLECFSVSSSSRRQLIGFVMIPIRGVPMISSSKGSKSVPRWHKLMGLTTEWKSLKPEISMYSSIMDPNQATKLASVQRDPKSLESIQTANMLCSQQGLFVKLLPDDHCIQLGNGQMDCTMFVVNIELRSLKGLRPSNHSDTDKLHIQYILFGSPSEDRLLVAADNDDHYSIHETINIQFRASVTTIREFFQNIFYIPIEVYCNDSVVGFIKFKVQIPPVNDHLHHSHGQIYGVFDRSFFVSGPQTPESSMIAASETTPYIEYELVLRLLNPPPMPEETAPTKPVQPVELPVEKVAIVEPIDFGGAGDHSANTRDLLSCRPPDCTYEPIKESLRHSRKPQSATSLPRSTKASPKITKVTPNTFSYRLSLQQVRFTRKVEPGIWQLSLHHPKAHTPVALLNISVRDTSGASTFDNVTIELLFSFEPSGIRAVIESEPCVLNIKGPHAAFATAELDNSTLLSQQCTPGIILMENEANEKIAIAHAFVELTDMGANLNAQQPKFTRFAQPNAGAIAVKPHLDEELAYKIVEELEDWKTQQQDAFLLELKRREIHHLARLTTEWTRRRNELESSLSQKLEQCSMLTSALEVANKNDKQLEDMDRQRLNSHAKCELQKACTKKLLHLQEQARRCEDDAAYEAKLAELRHKELQIKYDQLKLEHRQCRDLLAEMGAELERSGRRADEAENDRDLRPCAASGDDGNTTDSITDLIVTETAHLLAEQHELQTIHEDMEKQHWARTVETSK